MNESESTESITDSISILEHFKTNKSHFYSLKPSLIFNKLMVIPANTRKVSNI